MTKRLALLRPLSDAELEVMPHIADGLTYPQTGALLGLSKWAVTERVRSAAQKIPGSLPMRQRVEVWYRGGNKAMLRV